VTLLRSGAVSQGAWHRITDKAELEDHQSPLGRRRAASEVVGELYYHNYTSGNGLIAGAVFGRIAGRSAATHTNP
jgi:tricarballylate dehydrogenase